MNAIVTVLLILLGAGGAIFFCAQLNCYIEGKRNKARQAREDASASAS
jgi:hypothetical protein